MHKPSKLPFWLAVGLGLVLPGRLAGQVRGQDSGPQAPTPEYDHPNEVQALEGLFPPLTPPAEGVAPSSGELAELVERSRLLSSPCDQLRWLGHQIALLEAQPEAARALAELARQRAESIASVLEACRDDWTGWLKPPPEPPKPVYAILDVDELRQRLEQVGKEGQTLYELSPFQKLALLSRGCDDRLVLPRGPSPEWDVPRVVMDRLASGVELPAFGDLRSVQQRLFAAQENWSPQAAAAFGEPAERELAAATFRVAAAFLDRGLHLDPQDYQGLAPPVPYDDQPEAWSQLADALDAAALWTWAAAARILAILPAAGKPTGPQALAAVSNTWNPVRSLNPAVWRAVDDKASGWLARLGGADRLLEPGTLPLARAFRSDQRTSRSRYEDEVLALVSSTADPTDQKQAGTLLEAIQRAKAADLGLSLDRPVSLEKLIEQLGGETPWVYLFVEMIQVPDRQSGAVRFHGVAVYRTQYRTRTRDDRDYQDRYVAKVVVGKSSPEELVREALARPNGPPETHEARIIIAPDGPPSKGWLEFERNALLPRMTGGFDPSWIVYLPSVAALASDRWTLDATMRVWYRAALRSEPAMPAPSADSTALRTPMSLLGPHMPAPGMSAFRVWLDQRQIQPETELMEFLNGKKKADHVIPAIALWVKTGGPGR